MSSTSSSGSVAERSGGLSLGAAIPTELSAAGELEEILGQIKAALDHGLPYLAVVTALTLPDICSALESDNGEATRDKYMAWFDVNLAPLYPELTGKDCYKLRCGIIHQGRMGHRHMQYSRVVFSLPDGRGIVMHRNIADDVYNLDAALFCTDMANAVRRWYARVKDTKAVVANISDLVRYRPRGMPPYFVGVPVIA